MINNTIHYILITIIFAILALFGTGIYQQGILISELEQRLGGQIALVVAPNIAGKVDVATIERNANEANVQALLKEKNIFGAVSTVSENTFTVTALVADAEALKKADMSKGFSSLPVKKIYNVQITPATVFVNKKLSAFKVGDMVSILTNSPVLMVSTVNAVKVTYVNIGKL